MRVLLVEDEAPLRETLAARLKRDGFAVDAAGDGEEGLFLGREVPFDVAIIDLGLPKMSGMDLVKHLREDGQRYPILILTARSSWQDKVQGLKYGADDYLVKPFAFAELVARIRALVRRGRSAADAPRLALADLEVDLITRRVVRGGRPVDLTVREFELLEYLLRHNGQVVPREALARDVWKETARTTPLDNVIDVHIARLRRKVDNDQRVKLIHTVRGVGFLMREGEP